MGNSQKDSRVVFYDSEYHSALMEFKTLNQQIMREIAPALSRLNQFTGYTKEQLEEMRAKQKELKGVEKA